MDNQASTSRGVCAFDADFEETVTKWYNNNDTENIVPDFEIESDHNSV